MLSDKVKQVLPVEPLHDNIEGIRSVKKFDHSRNIIHLLHQSYLQWNIVFSNHVNVF